MTYGSTGEPTFSHRARMIKRDPSLAFGGVVFPRLASAPEPTLLPPSVRVVSSAVMLARLTEDREGRSPLGSSLSSPLLLSLVATVRFESQNKLSSPSGKSILWSVFITSHSFNTKALPKCFAQIAKSAAACPRDWVVEAACGVPFSNSSSPNALRNRGMTICSFCSILFFDSANWTTAAALRNSLLPCKGGALPLFLPAATFFLPPRVMPLVFFGTVVRFTLTVCVVAAPMEVMMCIYIYL
mmetsp:Transcript_13796/g.20342  ORF Transcript_13796/g.20342 Transcript_13796/m.20342 type:complete len:242 (-) Transcript_13796:245-970(-)